VPDAPLVMEIHDAFVCADHEQVVPAVTVTDPVLPAAATDASAGAIP
jgi:hypothetical protein